jgi:hypothetical protein
MAPLPRLLVYQEKALPQFFLSVNGVMANFSPSTKLSATRNIGDCFSLPVVSSVYVPPAEH